jgi:hypothetical protein
MPFIHRNREGKDYRLHVKTSARGRPTYFFSYKPKEHPVDEIPEGYEVYEKPDSAQVHLRRRLESSIAPAEREFVLAECNRLATNGAVLVELEPRAIVVYFGEARTELRDILFGGGSIFPGRRTAWDEWDLANRQYEKRLLFTLTDPARRLFHVSRWCFRDSIAGWIGVGSGALPLDRAVAKYAPHLGRESYFELGMWGEDDDEHEHQDEEGEVA